MKQLRIASQTDSQPDLLWVDEIAELLPENLRVGWYRNVKPWVATLSPEDEVAHLAYAMGYLGLLIRECPSLVAAERTKLMTVVQQISKETAGAVSFTAAYQQKFDERLRRLPAEIVNTAAFSSKIAEVIRGEFANSGLSEAQQMLRLEGGHVRTTISTHKQMFTELQDTLQHCEKDAGHFMDRLIIATDRINGSLSKWHREMALVKSFYRGLAILIFLLAGSLVIWSTRVMKLINAVTQADAVLHGEANPVTAPKVEVRRNVQGTQRK